MGFAPRNDFKGRLEGQIIEQIEHEASSSRQLAGQYINRLKSCKIVPF